MKFAITLFKCFEKANVKVGKGEDYFKYQNLPAIKKGLENFPFKQIIFNWNSLCLELKATANYTEFDQLLKQKLISQYSHETDCPDNCFSCNDI